MTDDLSHMPRLYWITIPAVFLLAFLVRWYLVPRPAPAPPAAETAAADPIESPPFTQVEEDAAPDGDELSGPEPDDEIESKGPLVFDQHPIQIKPNPEDEEVSASFTFTNASDRPVTIHRLESTCSCLEASLDQRTYAPGAKGSGKALFKVTSFVGRHEKTIHLYTDDPAAPEQIVTFILDVPVVVEIKPDFVEWAVGDPPEPKHMTFRMLGKDPMRITNITATRENVRYHLTEVTPGREYRLTLTPVSTAEITMGGLKIETDSKIPKYARQLAWFSISSPDLVEKRKKEVRKKLEELKTPEGRKKLEEAIKKQAGNEAARP